MDSVCFLSHVCLLLVGVIVSAEDVTVTEGQDVTLPCPAEELRPIEVVEWNRPGPESKHVLIFLKQNPELEIPEQYKHRVELKDMENGDVSLVLKNVTAEDSGTYECYVLGETNRRKRDIKPFNTVNLVVTPPPGNMDGSRDDGEKEAGGKQDGSGVDPVIVAACCCVFMVVLAVTAGISVVLVIRIQKRKKSMSSPNDEAEKTEFI